jgi:polysaccharide biosynthesis/export protein
LIRQIDQISSPEIPEIHHYCLVLTMNCISRHRRSRRSLWLHRTGHLGLLALLAQGFAVPAIAITNPIGPLPSDNSAVSPPEPAGEDYILGPGDRVRVEFFNVPEFSGEYTVLPNGSINMPRAGAVMLQGATLRQATVLINSRFSRYLTRPLVTLSLVAGRAVNVAIAGEINRPGAYAMTSALVGNTGGIQEIPTLTKLIRMAEGITQAADLKTVRIARRQADGNRVYQIDLARLMKAGDASQDIRLQDGDSIYIPVSESIDLAAAYEITRMNIASSGNRPLNIAVVGEVNRPGPYTIKEGSQPSQNRTDTSNSLTPTITQALQTAGGITQMANLRDIRVQRMTHTGRPQMIQVDFMKLLQSGDVLQDLPLQNGDRIEIARVTNIDDSAVTEIAKASFSPGQIAINVVGEVERPGSVNISPNTPLNQGLLAAGGFNKRARTKDVTLVRLEPNGDVSERKIAIDLSKGVDSTNNPALRNGDTIIVKRNPTAGIGDNLGLLTGPIGGALGLLRLLGIIR